MPQKAPLWSVIIPYYNEVPIIAETLASACALTGPPFRLILVDNGSTDGSEAFCRSFLADHPHVDAHYLSENTPGQLMALEKGLAAVDTPFVAFWNADTTYPPDYLAQAARLFEQPKVVAAMAIDIYDPPSSSETRRRKKRIALTSRILKWQCHTGTFGQCFRTDVLRRAGGPRSASWPWLLYDHELMQRVFKFGPSAYSADFWCAPSPRRADSSATRWSLGERILYHVTPFALKDWFFYRFLGPRFEKRGMDEEKLRIRDWE